MNDLIWTAKLDGRPAQPVLVAGELALLAAQTGTNEEQVVLHAFRLADGAMLWQHALPYAIVTGLQLCATEDGGVQLLVSASSSDLLRGTGRLLALDLDGGERWRWIPGVQRVSAPGVGAGRIVCTVDSETLVVLNDAGVEQTRVDLPVQAAIAAPALVADVAYVPGKAAVLQAVALDGTPRWRFAAEERLWLDRTPVVFAGRLFVSASSGKLFTLAREDGRLLWETAVGTYSRPLSTPAADEERVYVGAREGLFALDAPSGDVRWSLPTSRQIAAEPVIDDGVVYAAGHDHNVYALEAATGTVRWQHALDHGVWVAPSLGWSGETAVLLVVDRRGTLHAMRRPLPAAPPRGIALERLIRSGQWAAAAALAETQQNPARAAALWEKAGAWERAARQHEAACAWQAAARAWQQAERPTRQAQALVNLANALEDGAAPATEQSAAWQAARDLYRRLGSSADAEACHCQLARLRKLPIITVRVTSGNLLLNAWSTLVFDVRNEGFGTARAVVVHCTSGAQFAGQAARTQEIFSLQAGDTRVTRLDVKPLEYGESVPFRLRVDYQDLDGSEYAHEHTILLRVTAVSPPELATTQSVSDLFSPRAALLERLCTYFNLDELIGLCTELGLDHENLRHDTKPTLARELLGYLERRGRQWELLELCRKKRPSADWDLE